MIRYHRGKILVVERDGLEARSCECHRVVDQERARLLGLSDRHAGSAFSLSRRPLRSSELTAKRTQGAPHEGTIGVG